MKSSLLHDRRGAGLIQTLVVVAIVALASTTAIKALSTGLGSRGECAGKQIESLSLRPQGCDKAGTGGDQATADRPPPPPPAPAPRDPVAEALKELLDIAADLIGFTDAKKCITEGDIMACLMTALNFTPGKIFGFLFKGITKIPKIARAVDKLLDAKRAAQAAQDARRAEKAAADARRADELAAAAAKRCKDGKCDVPGSCFAAGTLVRTRTGPVAIEELKPGDVVWSRHDQTGEYGYRPVVRTFVTPDQPLLALAVVDASGAAETLEVTPKHPFWVEGLGWMAARDLEPDDELVSSDGGQLRVAGVSTTSRTTTVYNLEVEEFHTYFVGHTAVWVHNSCTVTSNIKSSYAIRKAEELSPAAQRDVNDLVKKLVDGGNPMTIGRGGRALGNGFLELRGPNAGRVIVKITGEDTYEIVGKFQAHVRGDAENGRIINRLINDYLNP